MSAGSATWSSTLTLTQGVTLAGAGVGNTVITASTTDQPFINIFPDATTISSSHIIKVTGFEFNGNLSVSMFLQATGASGISGTIPWRYLIIGNNKFENGLVGTSNGVITAADANNNGQIRGVIYGNTFVDTDILLRIFSNNDTREWANTAFNQFSFGTEDNLYFENNAISFTHALTGANDPGWVETGQGGRLAVRYNTWNLTNSNPCSGCAVWDDHGFQNWNGTANSGQTGTMLLEYYANTITGANAYYELHDVRGAQGLYFNNVVSSSGSISLDVYSMSVPGSCPSDINPTPANYNPVVNNTYFFNNTLNGSNLLAAMNPTGDPVNCSVTQNSNWWNYNSSCTASSCSAGIGQGTTAPTGTCTTGVGYWVASTPTATTSSSVIQSGTLYKCTSTNTWTAYYTPYQYPHPLASGISCSISPTSVGPYTAGQTSGFATFVASNCNSSSYTISAGSLSGSGLSLNSSTGALSGTAVAGSYNFTVAYGTASDPIALTINAQAPQAPTITTGTPLPSGTVGIPYSQSVSATGNATITWTLAGGSLPGGLSGCNSVTGPSCTISGTPTTSVSSSFTLTATNSGGSKSQTFSITINAAAPGIDCSTSANLQAAINAAARNATVTCNSTPGTWSSTVTITTGLTLQGAGVNNVGNTVITSSGGVALISILPDATAVANGETIRIQGFTFDGANTALNLLQIHGASGITGTKPWQYLIIGYNTFQNQGYNANDNESGEDGAIQVHNASLACPGSGAVCNGQIRGVIYKNIFDRCNVILRPFSDDDPAEWSNTSFNQPVYGTEDNLYFEDNTIQYSSSYAGPNPGWVQSGQGGRLAVRYNTWNLTNATSPAEVWDIHGFQNWDGTAGSGETGTMIAEYYGNTLSNMGTYRWIDDRGAQALFFNNILTGSGGNSIELYGMSIPGSCPSDINPTPTNYNPVVNNTYFFNNTMNGTNVLATMLASGNPTDCSVTENNNWWNYKASCTASSCSAGIGQGTTAPTGTCTTGVGYWVASTPTPTASASAIQNGAFYKCTATNTWQLYYMPYTYPHPLRAGGGSPSGPEPPTALTVTVK